MAGETGKSLKTLEAVIRHYRLWTADRAVEEAWWHAEGQPLSEAVRRAALATNPEGKRHSHQYRIPGPVLRRWYEALLGHERKLSQCATFDDLLELLGRTGKRIWGVGPLVIYDTADRLAWRLGRPPIRVYLHAGTREGARALGIVRLHRISFDPAELGPPLSKLSPRELEDILCIYKDVFAGKRPVPPDDQPNCGGRGRRRGVC